MSHDPHLVVFLESSSEAELESIHQLLLRALQSHARVPPRQVPDGEGGVVKGVVSEARGIMEQ